MSIVHQANREVLLRSPHVVSLTEKQIVYSKEFKRQALSASADGRPAPSIWLDAGFDITMFKSDYFRKYLARWRTQESRDFENLPRGRQASAFQSLKEENGYLKAENTILKELRALGVTYEITGSILSLELYRQIAESQPVDSAVWQELARVVFINGEYDQ